MTLGGNQLVQLPDPGQSPSLPESDEIFIMLDADGWILRISAATQRRHGTPLPVLVTMERVDVPEIGFHGVLGTPIDNTERRHLQGTLAHQALHDPMTGLPNRALLLDQLDQMLNRFCCDQVGGPAQAVLPAERVSAVVSNLSPSPAGSSS